MQKSVVRKNLAGNETKKKSQQTQGKSANAAGQPKRLEKKQVDKKQQKQPLGFRMMVMSVNLLLVLFVVWVFSSVFLRTIAFSYYVKIQDVQRQSVKIDKEIQSAHMGIAELTNYKRLQSIAEELGMSYSHDRIRFIIPELTEGSD